MTDRIAITRQGRIGPFVCGRISYGCWRFSSSTTAEARAKIQAAHDIGANLIDTAAIYGFGEEGFGEAEKRLGAAFAEAPDLRKNSVLVTKAGIHPPMPYDSRADTLISSCEQSLDRLQTDVIDIFLIHRPDLLVSFQEVAGALTHLRDAGKIREAGVSNFTPHQIRALQAHLDFPLVATQPEFSPLQTNPLDDGTLDIAQELSLGVLAWSPLGGGRLIDGAQAPAGSAQARVMDALGAIAQKTGCGVDHVALSWVLAHPANLFAIIGTQNLDRIAASARAFDVEMTRRDWYSVLEAARGAPMP